MALTPKLPDDQDMNTNGTIKLAENLNRLMKRKNLSLSQTAEAIQMNKSTLHNYLNGVVPRNVLTLKKLADFFQIGLTDLLFGPQITPEAFLRASLLEGTYELVIRRSTDESKKYL